MRISEILARFRRKCNKSSSPTQAAPPLPLPADTGDSSEGNAAELTVQHILVYAIEQEGLTQPKQEIRGRNFRLLLEPFNTEKRFNEFDGVILFQGCFEKIRRETDWTGNSYYTYKYDKDELDKRLNEAKLLLKQGGFICFLLCRPFIDHDDRGNSWEDMDLAKIFLNFSHFFRKKLSVRTTAVQCKRNEFMRFLELYGAAQTTFNNLNENIELKPIATVGSSLAGMIMWDERFFVPALVPENTDERVSEFFTLLVDALVATRNKLIREVPEWVDKFVFEEEASLSEEKSQAIARIEKINERLETYRKFKKALIQGNEHLVDTVSTILSDGFEFTVNSVDDFKEDLKILDDHGGPFVLCEVKGINRGVKREYVNQVDSHRERGGFPSSFPAVLIANTHIKNARNLGEKDMDVPEEQVVHARKNNVLILRTLDLLRLLRLKIENRITKETVLELLSGPGGWLKVSDDKWELIVGQQTAPPDRR